MMNLWRDLPFFSRLLLVTAAMAELGTGLAAASGQAFNLLSYELLVQPLPLLTVFGVACQVWAHSRLRD
jgi:hypothetical protein